MNPWIVIAGKRLAENRGVTDHNEQNRIGVISGMLGSPGVGLVVADRMAARSADASPPSQPPQAPPDKKGDKQPPDPDAEFKRRMKVVFDGLAEIVRLGIGRSRTKPKARAAAKAKKAKAKAKAKK